jgi:hypothetical protein
VEPLQLPQAAAAPPVALHCIGTVENKQGLKVAVLITDDHKEILTGQAGDVVANRIRILRIGFESVDVQDQANGRIWKIPFRGN